jgi:hypothetical protein
MSAMTPLEMKAWPADMGSTALGPIVRTEHQYWEAYCLLRTVLGKAVQYNDGIDVKEHATCCIPTSYF